MYPRKQASGVGLWRLKLLETRIDRLGCNLELEGVQLCR